MVVPTIPLDVGPLYIVVCVLDHGLLKDSASSLFSNSHCSLMKLAKQEGEHTMAEVLICFSLILTQSMHLSIDTLNI